MAKNLIFDFGAVLIPIDEANTWNAFRKLGAQESLQEATTLFQSYETGKISSDAFLGKLQPHFFRKNLFKPDLAEAWSAICYHPIPEEHIAGLKQLRKKGHALFLLSNTNALHIEKIKEMSGPFLYKQFINCFDAVYYSHEIGLRKPNKNSFEKVLKDQKLNAEDCFFVDDKAGHLKTAKKMGFETMHFQPEEQDFSDILKAIHKL